MRRLLLACLLVLCAFPAAAAAHDDPVGDHVDTMQELSDVNVVRDVGQARLRALDVGVSATTLPTTWCGTPTTTDDTLASGGANGVGELYEGSNASQRPDPTNVHNDGGLTSVMWFPDAAAPGANPNGWWPEGVLHEMTHNIGGVQWGSPHSSQPAGG